MSRFANVPLPPEVYADVQQTEDNVLVGLDHLNSSLAVVGRDQVTLAAHLRYDHDADGSSTFRTRRSETVKNTCCHLYQHVLDLLPTS